MVQKFDIRWIWVWGWMNFFLRGWVWDSKTRPYPAPLPSLSITKNLIPVIRNIQVTYTKVHVLILEKKHLPHTNTKKRYNVTPITSAQKKSNIKNDRWHFCKLSDFFNVCPFQIRCNLTSARSISDEI